MPLPALQSDFTCCSQSAETEMVVAGDCAWLQQMCGSALQPKNIPSVFHALTVVTSLWPAVWPVGCHPWKVALGAQSQARLIGKQRLCVSHFKIGSGERKILYIIISHSLFLYDFFCSYPKKKVCESQRPVRPLLEPVGELYRRIKSEINPKPTHSACQLPGPLPSAAIPQSVEALSRSPQLMRIKRAHSVCFSLLKGCFRTHRQNFL